MYIWGKLVVHFLDTFARFLHCFFHPLVVGLLITLLLGVFVGLRESMRQAELNNWSLEPTQIADLCSSINQFFARTGVIQQQGPVQPPVCHAPMHPSKPSQHLNTGDAPHAQPGSPLVF